MDREKVDARIEQIYPDYLGNLLEGCSAECVRLVTKLYEQGVAVPDIYLHLFQKSLYEVGHLWETNRISVAVEHIATAITEYGMSLLRPHLLGDADPHRQMIMACVSQEYHQIGARMVADICEHLGWNSIFIGANTPDDALVDMVIQERPALVGLSAALYANLPRVMKVIRAIKDKNPDQAIMVGGQAFGHGAAGWLHDWPRVFYIRDIDELSHHLPNLEREVL